MTHDHIEELASLAALGALDGEDLVFWEETKISDPKAGKLQAELNDVAAQLSFLATETKAPDELRKRVMNTVFASDHDRKPGNTPVNPQSHLGWAATAAVAAIAILALVGTAGITADKESVVVADARPNPQDLHIPLRGYGDYAGVRAGVLWDSGQLGWYVQAQGLPSLPATHRYHVWAVSPNNHLQSCGELVTTSTGTARCFVLPANSIDSMKGFAVTVEPIGTTPSQPGTPALLISPQIQS